MAKRMTITQRVHTQSLSRECPLDEVLVVELGQERVEGGERILRAVRAGVPRLRGALGRARRPWRRGHLPVIPQR